MLSASVWMPRYGAGLWRQVVVDQLVTSMSARSWFIKQSIRKWYKTLFDHSNSLIFILLFQTS